MTEPESSVFVLYGLKWLVCLIDPLVMLRGLKF